MALDKPVLAIGDCHGHLDRLEALLLQEGIIGPCSLCEGSGDLGVNSSMSFCPACDGNGTARLNHDVVVVQLGDLGHFGVTGSPTGDDMIYQYADKWIDVFLWGNHDRAVLHSSHAFSGYLRPLPQTIHRMRLLMHEGRYKLAYAAHGFLLTHAGLHKQFKYNNVFELLKIDPAAMAFWLNEEDSREDDQQPMEFMAIRDAIGRHRGGASPFGGILWRDASESLFQGYRQIFGHSAKDKVRKYQTPRGYSYCIDVGQANNGRLAAIWLPEERIVEVKV